MKYKITNPDGSIKSIHSDGALTIPDGAILLTDAEYYAIANAPEPTAAPDGLPAYKAMIRRRASKLPPIESVLLLKSIGE